MATEHASPQPPPPPPPPPFHLPDDVLIKILVTLPSQTLHRLKSVSKSWQTLISSPSFISLHLSHSLSFDSDRHLLLTSQSSLLTLPLDSPSPAPTPLPLPLFLPRHHLHIIGSHNGLICLTTSSHLIILNPSTHSYASIPQPPHSPFHPSDRFGFGYDSGAQDYNVVRVTYRHGELKEMVYSLNANEWVAVPQPSSDFMEYHMRLSDGNAAVVEGCLFHWYLEDRICCFHARAGWWTDHLPLPPDCTGVVDDDDDDDGENGGGFGFDLLRRKKKQMIDLRVLDGCLCVTTAKLNVWVMKEYGVEGSWVKLLRFERGGYPQEVDPMLVVSFPVCYRRGTRNRVLLWKQSHSMLLCYSKRDKKTRVVSIGGFPICDMVCLHKGSLVNIPGGRPVERG